MLYIGDMYIFEDKTTKVTKPISSNYCSIFFNLFHVADTLSITCQSEQQAAGGLDSSPSSLWQTVAEPLSYNTAAVTIILTPPPQKKKSGTVPLNTQHRSRSAAVNSALCCQQPEVFLIF